MKPDKPLIKGGQGKSDEQLQEEVETFAAGCVVSLIVFVVVAIIAAIRGC